MKWIAIAALVLAVLFGATVAYFNQISLLMFLPSFISVVFGSVLILFGAHIYDYISKNISYFSALSLTFMGMTLCFQGYDGVRRWIFMGPVQLNVSLALAPILLLALAHLKIRESVLTALITCAVYFFQPDASQASAFAVAAAMIFIFRKDFTIVVKGLSCVSVLAIAIATWFQKDPLPSVAHVEDILRLAFGMSLFFKIGALAVIVLLFLPLSLVLVKSRLTQKRVFVGSLLIFWIVAFVSTEIGFYPVPVIGAGFAGILGWSLSYILIFGFESTDSALNLSSSI